jgi:hypothetical protein
MPRGREEPTSGASGRWALATFRDDDFEDFIAAVRWLPTLAAERGRSTAVAFYQTEVRSLVALFRLSKPEGKDEIWLREAVASVFSTAVANLLCDRDEAGFACGTAVIQVVERWLFEPSVRVVFERSAPTQERPYVANVPA